MLSRACGEIVQQQKELEAAFAHIFFAFFLRLISSLSPLLLSQIAFLIYAAFMLFHYVFDIPFYAAYARRCRCFTQAD